MPIINHILQAMPLFDSHYKNPCWSELLTSAHVYTNNSYVQFSPSAKKTLDGLDDHWMEKFVKETSPSRLR